MLGITTQDMCPAARRLFIGAIVLAIVGTIFVVVGIGLPFWRDDGSIHSGVFQVCEKTFKSCDSTQDIEVEYKEAEFFPLLWGLAIVGLIFLVVGLVFLFTYPVRKEVDHCKVALVIFTSVALILAVISFLACMAIFLDWYVRYDSSYSGSRDIWEDVGFSWYITLVGVICLVACVICLGLHVFFMIYYSNERNKIHAYR